jgi:hypothetical protein
LFNIFWESRDQTLGFIGFILKHDLNVAIMHRHKTFSGAFSQVVQLIFWNKPPTFPIIGSYFVVTVLCRFHFIFWNQDHLFWIVILQNPSNSPYIQ